MQCTKTCTSDSDCERGTCEAEDGGDGEDDFFSQLFGGKTIKLCIPTCEETTDCGAGEWCLERETDIFTGGFFSDLFGGGSSNEGMMECVPDAFECTEFNNGDGCPDGTACGAKSQNQLYHKACMNEHGATDPSECYTCHDPSCFLRNCGDACTPVAFLA